MDFSHCCYGCGTFFDGEENDYGDVRCTECGSEDTVTAGEHADSVDGPQYGDQAEMFGDGDSNVFTNETGMVCDDCGSTFEDSDIHWSDDGDGQCPNCLSESIHGA